LKRSIRILIERFNTEFEILLSTSIEQIGRISSPEIAEGINRVRQGKINISPGYDGEYGKIEIFKKKERGKFSKQANLF